MTVLLVALGAAVGAPLRFCLASWLDASENGFPYGTFAVNVAGSFLLGIFSALSLGEQTFAVLGTGFCGAFTTYSAFAVQTVRGGPRTGAVYAAATIVVSVAACAAGFVLAPG